jgi:hypothetical protein
MTTTPEREDVLPALAALAEDRTLATLYDRGTALAKGLSNLGLHRAT